MHNSTGQLATAGQLAALTADGMRYELVAGVLRMMSPAGREHGRVAGRLFLRIGNHVERNKLGEAYAAETGFLLAQNPDTVRAPDVSFVAAERLSEFAGHRGYLPLAPDWAAVVAAQRCASPVMGTKATGATELVSVVPSARFRTTFNS